MSRGLVVAWVGRRKRSEYDALCEVYRERVLRFAPVRDVPVKPVRSGDESTRLTSEGRALLSAFPEPAWIVALDRRGRSIDSPGWAEYLSNTEKNWPHAIVFALGSDLGLSEEVLEKARLRLSLGPITLPHELARVVVYEQLYRALSIRAGMRYHREPLT